MTLSAAQLQTLHDDIVTNTHWGEDPADLSRDANQRIADVYNAVASPDFIVWKNLVSLDEVGASINGQNVADVTAANADRLAVFFQIMPGGVKPFRADHRAFFDDVFSGAPGTETLAALNGNGTADDGLWRRLATLGEKLFATGTGDNATPATLGFEGQITQAEVSNARRLS